MRRGDVIRMGGGPKEASCRQFDVKVILARARVDALHAPVGRPATGDET
ncbi:MAG: hypothetical protein RBU30_24585 [Polyangia bacterium]|nr:hypothetical protein [Polyangia bacterium]